MNKYNIVFWDNLVQIGHTLKIVNLTVLGGGGGEYISTENKKEDTN